MPMAAGLTSPTDGRAPPPMAGPPIVPFQSASMVFSDSYAKDAIIAWFKGEFAAANAIIDALCSHLAQLSANSGRSEYDSLFAAMHMRRANWIPVIQMQKFHSIADITFELSRIGLNGGGDVEELDDVCRKKYQEDVRNCLDEKEKADEKSIDGADETTQEYDSPDSEITDSVLWTLESITEFRGGLRSENKVAGMASALGQQFVASGLQLALGVTKPATVDVIHRAVCNDY